MDMLFAASFTLLLASHVFAGDPNRLQIGTRCGTRFLRLSNGQMGYLDSPGYGAGGYNNYEGCTWVLKGPYQKVTLTYESVPSSDSGSPPSNLTFMQGSDLTKKVSLTFESLEVEAHSRCAYDFVQIADSSDNHVATICGSQCMASTVVQSNRVKIHFNADRNITRNGFRLRYQVVDSGSNLVTCNCDSGEGCIGPNAVYGTEVVGTCGGTFYGAGVLASPGYPMGYSNYEDCTWTISVATGMSVIMEFDEFDVEGGSGCPWDSLTIYGGIADMNFRYKLCGDLSDVPSPLYIYDNEATLVFDTDSSVTGDGFVIRFYGGMAPATLPPPTFAPYDGACGVRPSTTIVGGNEAEPNTWPWMVMLLKNNAFSCGGSIIHPNWVITAAHCTEGTTASSMSVKAGAHNAFTYEPTQQTRQVSTLYQHYNYNSGTLENDISLLYFDIPFEFSSIVSPICLSRTHPPDGVSAYITGWGNTEVSGYPDELYEAMVPFLNTGECNRSDRYDGEIINFAMFCAGYFSGGIDTCQGDSGGPLSSDYTGAWTLYGLTSWGYGCADYNNPGVYTKVANYIDWIEDNASGAIVVD